jgi:hypothetical protein
MSLRLLSAPNGTRTSRTYDVADSEERAALNESLFRELNERLESRIRVFSSEGERLTVVCECAERDCAERIDLAPEEYQTVRSRSDQFVIVPGHECLDVEEIVAQTDRFDVVRKKGRPAEIARELDPSGQVQPSP